MGQTFFYYFCGLFLNLIFMKRLILAFAIFFGMT